MTMANEDMKQLLLNGEIVGYMYHSQGKILFTKDIKNWLEGLLLDIGGFKVIDPLKYYIKHDSFEQGIRVGDEWWFEGDIGETIKYENTDYGKFTLLYTGLCWKTIIHSDEYKREWIVHGLKELFDSKRIGSIHDKGQEGKDES